MDFAFITDPLTNLIIWGVVIVLVVIVLVTILRGIKVAKPDEAIIVTSRQKRIKGEDDPLAETAGQRVVFGSRVFVKPIVEAYFTLSLRSRQLNVQATAQTKDAITIKVNAVAVVKVGGSESMVRAAAQRFLNQQDQIETSTEEVLSGSVRSIVGQLTVTEIITNRSALQGQVLEAVRDSLDVQGLQIDTLQIKGNAVTVPLSTTASAVLDTTLSYQDALTLTISSTGVPVLLWVSFNFKPKASNNDVMRFRLRDTTNGVDLFGPFDVNGLNAGPFPIGFSTRFTPAVATTVKLQVLHVNDGYKYEVGDRTMLALTVKK